LLYDLIMKSYLLTSLLFAAFLFLSCRQNNIKELSAKIIERKMLANGKLMLSYVFKADGKLINGSAVMENKVIPADTLTVIFHKENPAESRIRLPY